jgi:tetratricopeptide (TPR) repeat protein
MQYLRNGALAALFVLAGAACVEPASEHRVRANAFLRSGNAEAAFQECNQGLAKKNGDMALLILRGKALFELDRLDEARASYADALRANKGEDASPAEAHLGLAMIASRQRDPALARTHFEALVKLNDKDATSLLNVARTCLELKDMECAIARGEAAGRLRGDDEGVLYTLGTIYLAAGKLEDATLTFQHICDVVPGAASCPYGKALVAAKSGEKPKALEHLREAIARKIPNPDQIAADPGFASLKDDAEFQALVTKAATK